jgi:DNA primase
VSELNEILEALDLESYLDHMGVEYRTRPGSSGRQLNIKTCPSCGDNNWKVYANESTGLGNCFKGGCQLGTFNKYKFIRALLGDAAHREVIAHIKESASAMGWRARRKAAAVDWSGSVELPTSIELPDIDGNNLEYLESRGVTGDLARFFNLRYCHTGGHKMEVDGAVYRQDYSGRVIIPIFDLEGNLKTFQGRDITGAKEPKYLFPPGLSASGRYLYNGHNAWQSSHIVVGEGVFDVIAIHAALQEDPALRNVAAVGTFGMHLSVGLEGDTQIDAFASLKAANLRTVTIMWDSEPAALRSAIKAADKLRGIGLTVNIAILPKGKDPNEVSGAVVRKQFLGAVNPSDAAGAKSLLRAIMF